MQACVSRRLGVRKEDVTPERVRRPSGEEHKPHDGGFAARRGSP